MLYSKYQDAAQGLDITVATGNDKLEDFGHKLVLAAFSPVVSSCPEADLLILTEWSSNDYSILLDLLYNGSGR